jgi:hypothetical protein
MSIYYVQQRIFFHAITLLSCLTWNILEWAGDGCLMSMNIYLSFIMARTSEFDEIAFLCTRPTSLIWFL